MLLSATGLDTTGGLVPPSPPGLPTNMLLSQRELMMRSLLDGSIPVSQRRQIQKDYHISDRDLQDFAASGPSTTTTNHPRPTTGQKRPRRRPLPPFPAGSGGRGGGGGGGGGGSPGRGGGGEGGSPGGTPGSDGSRRRGRRRLDQDGLRRQMDLLSQDACQRTDGRRIRNITHTNTVTTVNEDSGTPTVRRTSSRISNT